MTTQPKSIFEKTLDELDLVYFDIHGFGGKRTLDAAEIPESDRKAVNPGTIWTIDKEHLRPFERLRAEVRRMGLRYGTQLMGGFAFPKDKTQAFLDSIKTVKSEWDENVGQFILNYDQYVTDWQIGNPSRAASIARAAPPRDAISGKFRFAFQGYTINPADIEGSTLLQEDLEGLPAQVCKEIAQELKDNFDGKKGVVSQRVRRLIQRIKAKFDSFAFLDPALASASTRIDAVLIAMPKTGPIAGNDFLILAGLISVLQQPSKVLAGQLDTVIPAAAPQDELFEDEEPEAPPAATFAPPPADEVPAAVMASQSAVGLDLTGW